nr:hypothetical protein [uncultured bacterium]
MLGTIVIAHADVLPAAESKQISKIRPLLAEAEKVAQKWKSDAVLVGINIKAEADGTIDLDHLAAPPNFNGGLATVTYRSNSAIQTMTLNSKGSWDSSVALPVSPTDEKPPLAAEFLDLDEALAAAQKQGLKLPAKNGRNYVDFALTAQKDPSGGADRATWAVSSIELPVTRIPSVLGQVMVAANSGKAMTREQADGTESLNRKLERLKEGRPLPRDAKDVAAWGREADKLAAEYRADLRPYEISLSAGYERKKFVPHSAAFRYFGLSTRPSVEGEWLTTELRTDGRRIWIESFETLHRIDHLFPREIPTTVLSPEAALAQLWKQNLNVPAGELPLLLCHSALLPAGYKRPAEPNGPGMSDDPAHMPEKQWVWRTVGQRDEEIVAKPFKGKRAVLAYVYMNAISKEASEQLVSPLLETILVGTWEMEVSGSRSSWTINADSSYSYSPEGANAAAGHEGTFFGLNGRWTLQSTTNNWSDGGTYRLTDADTLEMEGRLGKGVWKRKAGTKAVVGKDEASLGKPRQTLWAAWSRTKTSVTPKQQVGKQSTE